MGFLYTTPSNRRSYHFMLFVYVYWLYSVKSWFDYDKDAPPPSPFRAVDAWDMNSPARNNRNHRPRDLLVQQVTFRDLEAFRKEHPGVLLSAETVTALDELELHAVDGLEIELEPNQWTSCKPEDTWPATSVDQDTYYSVDGERRELTVGIARGRDDPNLMCVIHQTAQQTQILQKVVMVVEHATVQSNGAGPRNLNTGATTRRTEKLCYPLVPEKVFACISEPQFDPDYFEGLLYDYGGIPHDGHDNNQRRTNAKDHEQEEEPTAREKRFIPLFRPTQKTNFTFHASYKETPKASARSNHPRYLQEQDNESPICSDGFRAIEIAVLTDSLYCETVATSNTNNIITDYEEKVAAATSAAMAIVEETSMVYFQPLCLTLVLRQLEVYCDPAVDPFADMNGPRCSDLLRNFRNYMTDERAELSDLVDNSHLFHGHVPTNISFANAIGCAYVGSICIDGLSTTVDRMELDLTGNAKLLGHEIGHNLGARHSSNPLDLMFASIRREDQSFLPDTVEVITNTLSQPFASCVEEYTFPPSSSPTTLSPTDTPTILEPEPPSDAPTEAPTSEPSDRLTNEPSDHPSDRPSNSPTEQPTEKPSDKPTDLPSSDPTRKPTGKPSDQPSERPTNHPTNDPTSRPTGKPSERPTNHPTFSPSNHRTFSPSDRPTNNPTYRPTVKPADKPTSQPTDLPTVQPTSKPTGNPSDQPTYQPTDNPSFQPSKKPSNRPTDEPTAPPTSVTPFDRTDNPTNQPSDKPTIAPTDKPTDQPTFQPTSNPTVQPTSTPTDKPSDRPTDKPSDRPTSKPTGIPTGLPTEVPTRSPSFAPTGTPSTTNPTLSPSTPFPSSNPTSKPSFNPSYLPSSRPSSIPSSHPTETQTTRPTNGPSSAPTQPPLVAVTATPTTNGSTGLPSAPFNSLTPTTRPTSEISETSNPTERPSRRPSNGICSSNPESRRRYFPRGLQKRGGSENTL